MIELTLTVLTLVIVVLAAKVIRLEQKMKQIDDEKGKL